MPEAVFTLRRVGPTKGLPSPATIYAARQVVVENAPKSLSRHDGASVIRACRQRCEELVAETLVVPFCVIVHYVFGYPEHVQQLWDTRRAAFSEPRLWWGDS